MVNDHIDNPYPKSITHIFRTRVDEVAGAVWRALARGADAQAARHGKAVQV